MQHEMDHPDFSQIRRGLFWDTDFKKIDWREKRRTVIERILERGNDIEKAEINRFYGESVVLQMADEMKIKMPVSYTGITVKSHLEDN